MRVGLRHARPVLLDDAVGPDPHGRADDAGHLLAVHHLLAVGAVRRHGLLRRVREQGERQLVLGAELLVRRAVVGRDTEHHRPALLVGLPVVAEAARFLRTAGRVVLRIEIEDDVLAGEVGERDLLAVLVGERECGRLLAFDDRHRCVIPSTSRFVKAWVRSMMCAAGTRQCPREGDKALAYSAYGSVAARSRPRADTAASPPDTGRAHGLFATSGLSMAGAEG